MAMNRETRRKMKAVQPTQGDVITGKFHRRTLEFLYQQTARMVGSDSYASRIIAETQEELERALGIELPPALPNLQAVPQPPEIDTEDESGS